MKALDLIETFLSLLFGAIILTVIFKNPNGTTAILQGFGGFAHDVADSFTGSSISVPSVPRAGGVL